jgi:DNA-binding NarL/FixJ family response regulator
MHRILVLEREAVRSAPVSRVLCQLAGQIHVERGDLWQTVPQPARGCGWDVVIVDSFVPWPEAYDRLAQLRQACPNTPVVVIATVPDPLPATQCLRQGVAAYLLEQSVGWELVPALQQVLRGDTYVSSSLALCPNPFVMVN